MKMACPYCDGMFTRQEWESGGGKWVAEYPEQETRGFHVNAMDSQTTWEELVVEFIEAERLSKVGNHSSLISFINTRLAETWEERGEVVESHALETRREVYNAEIPDGVCVLTMGIDVQDTRLAVGVWGWGLGFENWLISYQEFWGDPRQGEVWNRIDDLLVRTFSYANGKRIKIIRVAADTGGHCTPSVYAYCKARQSRGVYPIKGQGGDRLPLTRPSQESREKGLFIVGVDGIKSDLMSWLNVGQPGNGYCHFPKDRDGQPVNGCDADFFAMLTAEKRVMVQNKVTGFSRYEWHKSASARNEAWDVFCYARAALRILSPNDEAMLQRVFSMEPWSEKASNKIIPGVNKKKNSGKSRNQIARERGVPGLDFTGVF